VVVREAGERLALGLRAGGVVRLQQEAHERQAEIAAVGRGGNGRAIVLGGLGTPAPPLRQTGGALSSGGMTRIGGQRLLAERGGGSEIAGGLAVGRRLDQLVYTLHRGPPIARSGIGAGGSRNLNPFSTIPRSPCRSRVRFNCFKNVRCVTLMPRRSLPGAPQHSDFRRSLPLSLMMRVQRPFGSALRRGIGGDHGSELVLAARRDGSFEGEAELDASPLAAADAPAGGHRAGRCVRVRCCVAGRLPAAWHADSVASANSAALKKFGLSLCH